MDKPRFHLRNSINSKHNLPTQPNQTSQFMIIRAFFQRDNVHEGLNLVYHCSLPEFCSDVEYSCVWLGQAPFMSQEQRPAAIDFCFHPVWAHHFLLLLLFSLLFQTLLFFLASALANGWHSWWMEQRNEAWEANIRERRGQSYEQSLYWLQPAALRSTRATPTHVRAILATSHLPPPHSQNSISHHCLSEKDPRVMNCCCSEEDKLVGKWRKGTRQQRHDHENQSSRQFTLRVLLCKYFWRKLFYNEN